jgi:hypothetical protein
MSFDLSYYFALWRIQKLPPERVPGIAIEALEAGFDSPALRRLAALQEPSSADIGTLFDQAMNELGLSPATQEQIESRQTDEWIHNAVPLARHIAKQIIGNEVDIAQAWLSIPYRDGELGPLGVFFEKADPTSCVVFDEDFRLDIGSAARQFLELTAV